jgi:hypothetical protein
VIKEVKDFLSRSFEMKDLGVADVMLNIKLLRDDNDGITLLQSHYVEKVMTHFGYSDKSLLQHRMILICFFKRIKWTLEIN